jgi:hypothetical protein
MKKLILNVLSIAGLAVLIPMNSLAQGWVGGPGDVLYPVNSGLTTSPMSLGIGLTNPTAQLHTTGTVRFQGLPTAAQSMILASDASGNISLMPVSSLPSSATAWLLAGNAVVASDFIGTTNNQDFRIRTNNIQRMVVAANGQVGIGSTAGVPIRGLDYRYSDPSAYSATNAWGRNGMLIYNDLATANLNQCATLAFSTRGAAGMWQATAYITGVQTGLNQMDLVFQNEYDGPAITRESMRITSAGFVGINVAAANIDSYLHTDGGIRHENLPVGSGKHLVIDGSGYVYISDTKAPEEQIQDLQNEVDLLKSELEEIKAMIDNGAASNSVQTLSASWLGQVKPNPTTNNEATIEYSVKADASSAYIVVFDASGKQLEKIQVSGTGSITVDVAGYQRGIYQYALVVNDVVVDSKKIMVGQ